MKGQASLNPLNMTWQDYGREGLTVSTASSTGQQEKIFSSTPAAFIMGPSVNKSPVGFYSEGDRLQGEQ